MREKTSTHVRTYQREYDSTQAHEKEGYRNGSKWIFFHHSKYSPPARIQIIESGFLLKKKKKLKYSPQLQNKLLCCVCPGASTIANHTRVSNRPGWVLYFMSPLPLKLGRLFSAVRENHLLVPVFIQGMKILFPKSTPQPSHQAFAVNFVQVDRPI